MAIFASLFGGLGRFAGTLPNSALGWASSGVPLDLQPLVERVSPSASRRRSGGVRRPGRGEGLPA